MHWKRILRNFWSGKVSVSLVVIKIGNQKVKKVSLDEEAMGNEEKNVVEYLVVLALKNINLYYKKLYNYTKFYKKTKIYQIHT